MPRKPGTSKATSRSSTNFFLDTLKKIELCFCQIRVSQRSEINLVWLLLFIFSTGSGIKVLELAAGTGNYSIALASKYPKSTFTGLDYSEHAVKLARELQKENKVENASFVHGDGHNLPETWTASFDLVFVSMLHDLSDPPKCIEEVLRIMKPNGCFSVFENGYHSDPVDNANDISASMCYVLSMYYCLTSSLADPPHVGYGSMWGIEEIEKTLKMFPLKIQRFDSKGQYWPISSFHCTRKQS